MGKSTYLTIYSSLEVIFNKMDIPLDRAMDFFRTMHPKSRSIEDAKETISGYLNFIHDYIIPSGHIEIKKSCIDEYAISNNEFHVKLSNILESYWIKIYNFKYSSTITIDLHYDGDKNNKGNIYLNNTNYLKYKHKIEKLIEILANIIYYYYLFRWDHHDFSKLKGENNETNIK